VHGLAKESMCAHACLPRLLALLACLVRRQSKPCIAIGSEIVRWAMTRTCRPSSSELLRVIAGAKVVKDVDVVDGDTHFEQPIGELESCVDVILRIFRPHSYDMDSF
jgi:hypothetical protein